MNRELILVLDFGGKYNQLIGRRVREANVYSEVLPYHTSIDKIKTMNPKGIIFTGDAADISDSKAKFCDKGVLDLGVPILGISYGMQLINHVMGGTAKESKQCEYSRNEIHLESKSKLFEKLEGDTVAWMNAIYFVDGLPEGFAITARTKDGEIAAIENEQKKLYAVQFNPEVSETVKGKDILNNFLYNICGCKGDWKMSTFVERSIQEIKEKVGDKKVLCGLSGGVDSSVAAVMIHKAIGKQLTCILVDHGLLRKNEGDQVEELFQNQYDINLIRVNAQDRFLDKLKGVSDPEKKRKIIGEEFIRVFEAEAKKIGKVDFLVQGTIYPDVIESGSGDEVAVKSHHNVGGLPDHIDFKEIIEPLRNLFKEEVRKAGLELGIPEDMVMRQPFPGPGLAIRIIGDITREKLDILREADYIFREEIKKAGLDREVNQYFTVLTNMRSVGVTADKRTYDYTLALRAVTTTDFMTAEWARLPYDLLERASNRIVNEVGHINRVVYDITGKPPATIEWE